MIDSGSKAGLPPGTIVHTGPKRVDRTKVRIIDYDAENMDVLPDEPIDQCKPCEDEGKIRWIHVNGVHEVDKIEEIATNFGIHPLVIEDIASTMQRPKIEILRDSVYIVLRGFTYDKKQDVIFSEQISIILGKGYVLSFQESADDIFEPVIRRLLHQESRLRTGETDYLAYSLLDLIVDYYFIVLEIIGDKIEALEDEIVNRATEDMLGGIYALKRNLLLMKKFIWPLGEVILRFNRDEASMIEEETQVFLRDLYDHAIRAIDHIEIYRDSLTAMLDIYLTSISNKMNEVMKVLTVISTVFIPITFLASIYGMNFPIPEYQFQYGYPVLLLVMLVISLVLLAYFRRLKWI